MPDKYIIHVTQCHEMLQDYLFVVKIFVVFVLSEKYFLRNFSQEWIYIFFCLSPSFKNKRSEIAQAASKLATSLNLQIHTVFYFRG